MSNLLQVPRGGNFGGNRQSDPSNREKIFLQRFKEQKKSGTDARLVTDSGYKPSGKTKSYVIELKKLSDLALQDAYNSP